MNVLTAASLVLGGGAASANALGPVRTEKEAASGYALSTTPAQCAIWRLTNPDLYRKYCL